MDCGTNATRVLIADVGPGGRMREVTRQLRITRMGADLGRTGAIGAPALERVATTLRRYMDLCDHFGVDGVTVLATSAAREAGNTDAFRAVVEDVVGAAPHILTGDEEAAATYRGALAGLAVTPPALVVDLGGGSTEFAMEVDDEVGTRSLALGSVRLAEAHLPDLPASAAAIGAAAQHIDTALEPLGAALPVADAATVVAVAGTALTLAALERDVDDPDDRSLHGAFLSRDIVGTLARDLLATPPTALARRPVITPGREDVIGPGALILDRVLALLDAPGLVVSRHDLLDDAVRRLAVDGAAAARAQPVHRG